MQVRKALGISAFSQIITFVLNFLNVIVVSRLLTPSEIGVFSVAVSFQAIAHVFREFGVNQYLIQAKTVSESQFRAAFTLTLMFSWAIALALFFGASPLAAFYSHQGVKEVLAMLALNFVLMPFGTPSLGMLRRELRFEALAGIRIVNAATASVVTIAAAWLGESYLSMAWGAIAGHIANLCVLSFVRPRGLLMFPSFKGISEVFRFGSAASAATLIHELGQSAPDIVLGRTLGFSSVAFYSRAAGLRDMLLGQLNSLVNGVHFPTFAEAIRKGADPAHLYTRAIGYMLAITIPAMAILALLAKPLIIFIFGEQWAISAPLASQLCVFGIITAPYALANLSLVAGGHIASTFWVALFIHGSRIAVLLTSIALPLEQVVPLLGIAALVEAGAYQYHLRMRFGLTLRAIGIQIKSAFLLMLATLSVPLIISLFFWPDNSKPTEVFLFLAASGVSAAAGWVSGVLLLRHPFRDELLRLIQHVSKRHR